MDQPKPLVGSRDDMQMLLMKKTSPRLENKRSSPSPKQDRRIRGTVSDVRSLVKMKKICIEGFLSRREKDGKYTRAWYVLDIESPELKGYGGRPLGDQEKVVASISLDEVAQVQKVTSSEERTQDLKRSAKIPQLEVNKYSFRLADASDETIAQFRCRDNSTLLWWLHGFQRRIFEQTKGILRQKKKAEPTPDGDELKKYQTLPRSMTVSGATAKPQRVKATWLSATSGAVQGRRRTMEDETVIYLDLNNAEEAKLSVQEHGQLALVGVFDGHAGRECAEYASEFIVENLISQPAFLEHNLSQALVNAFVQTDAEFRQWALGEDNDVNISGSTALVILFRDREVYVANAGDCRAVLCRKGSALALSTDHKPNREDEAQRIEEAGGWIDSREVLNIPKLYALGLEHQEVLEQNKEQLVGWVTVHKVCGALAMTRSLGDVLIKDRISDNFECVYEEGFQAPLILAEPDVLREEIQAGDEFIILACDGLWDVFSSEEAVAFVMSQVDANVDRDDIVENIMSRALELGSLDNISCVIIWFT